MKARRILFVSLLFALAATMAGCGIVRVFFPSSHHDVEPPELPAELARPAVLVFSKTNGFRHEEAIPAGQELYRELAATNGWSVFFTENGAVHDAEQLARFDAVVWHNVSGDVLDDEQRAALVAYLEGGGGFVGIHGTGGDSSYAWDFHVNELVGAQFIGHIMGPQFQDASLVIEDRTHPATRHLPTSWVHNEEWYSFDRSVREREGFSVLLSVDEASYSPIASILWFDKDLSMGDHPVVWTHCIGRGRVFYSALGHQAAAYRSPEYRSVLEGATRWALGDAGEGCGVGAAADGPA